MPLIVAPWFRAKQEQDGQYDRLARVLAYTAQQHCPDWQVQIDEIHPTITPTASGNPSHGWNTSKLAYWQEAIEAAPDGAHVLLMDADTVILRPLDPLWSMDFELAYTVRDHANTRLPLNGGVVPIRVSDRTRDAMRRWRNENDRMTRDVQHHQVWRRKYGGINQASFGYLLETGGFDGLQVITLPCQTWNCVEWGAYRPDVARILHVKSALRRAVFGFAASNPTLTPLVRLWRDLERAMLLEEADARVGSAPTS